MSDKNNLNFKMKVAEWRGYVQKSLEDIEKGCVESKKETKDGFKELKIELVKINSRINHLYFKVGTIGGTVGLVVSLVMWLIVKFT